MQAPPGFGIMSKGIPKNESSKKKESTESISAGIAISPEGSPPRKALAVPPPTFSRADGNISACLEQDVSKYRPKSAPPSQNQSNSLPSSLTDSYSAVGRASRRLMRTGVEDVRVTAPSARTAQGPDGSKGFKYGRGKNLTAPSGANDGLSSGIFAPGVWHNNESIDGGSVIASAVGDDSKLQYADASSQNVLPEADTIEKLHAEDDSLGQHEYSDIATASASETTLLEEQLAEAKRETGRLQHELFEAKFEIERFRSDIAENQGVDGKPQSSSGSLMLIQDGDDTSAHSLHEEPSMTLLEAELAGLKHNAETDSQFKFLEGLVAQLKLEIKQLETDKAQMAIEIQTMKEQLERTRTEIGERGRVVGFSKSQSILQREAKMPEQEENNNKNELESEKVTLTDPGRTGESLRNVLGIGPSSGQSSAGIFTLFPDSLGSGMNNVTQGIRSLGPSVTELENESIALRNRELEQRAEAAEENCRRLKVELEEAQRHAAAGLARPPPGENVLLGGARHPRMSPGLMPAGRGPPVPFSQAGGYPQGPPEWHRDMSGGWGAPPDSLGQHRGQSLPHPRFTPGPGFQGAPMYAHQSDHGSQWRQGGPGSVPPGMIPAESGPDGRLFWTGPQGEAGFPGGGTPSAHGQQRLSPPPSPPFPPFGPYPPESQSSHQRPAPSAPFPPSAPPLNPGMRFSGSNMQATPLSWELGQGHQVLHEPPPVAHGSFQAFLQEQGIFPRAMGGSVPSLRPPDQQLNGGPYSSVSQSAYGVPEGHSQFQDRRQETRAWHGSHHLPPHLEQLPSSPPGRRPGLDGQPGDSLDIFGIGRQQRSMHESSRSSTPLTSLASSGQSRQLPSFSGGLIPTAVLLSSAGQPAPGGRSYPGQVDMSDLTPFEPGLVPRRVGVDMPGEQSVDVGNTVDGKMDKQQAMPGGSADDASDPGWLDEVIVFRGHTD